MGVLRAVRMSKNTCRECQAVTCVYTGSHLYYTTWRKPLKKYLVVLLSTVMECKCAKAVAVPVWKQDCSHVLVPQTSDANLPAMGYLRDKDQMGPR